MEVCFQLAWRKVVDEYRSGSRQGFRRLDLRGQSHMNEMLDAFRYRLFATPAGSLRHFGISIDNSYFSFSSVRMSIDISRGANGKRHVEGT